MHIERELLTFIVPRDSRDEVVDILMLDRDIPGFTVTDSQGFSREHAEYSIEEQVAGYRAVARFEIVCRKSEGSGIVATLQQQLGTPVQHWIVDTPDAGHAPRGP